MAFKGGDVICRWRTKTASASLGVSANGVATNTLGTSGAPCSSRFEVAALVPSVIEASYLAGRTLPAGAATEVRLVDSVAIGCAMVEQVKHRPTTRVIIV